ncbi:MAG: heme A synthase [Deltaproteobacteria bacterium]|nr:heme A synthase [Deltaproteobacteria bacterium]
MKEALNQKSFYWFLFFWILVWFLITLGGIFHNTGSSLACPDWPTFHGTFFPKMEGEVAIEHGHRLLGTVVGCYAIVLCFVFWKKQNAFLKWGTILALALVIFQGLLGGLTVLWELPPWVSTTHLATAMAFLGLIVFLMWKSYHGARESLAKFKFKPLALLTLLALYGQMILGAYMRHKGAGLACTEVPFCQGGIWPKGADFLLHLHLLHRWFAFGVLLLLITFLIRLWSKASIKQKALAIVLIFLVSLQILLGFLSVYTALEIIPVTAHLALGALIWSSFLWLYLSLSYGKNS